MKSTLHEQRLLPLQMLAPQQSPSPLQKHLGILKSRHNTWGFR